MPDTQVAITELLEIDPDRVDAVSSPANGTDWLILKAIDDSETVATTDEIVAELDKSEREKCDICEGIAKSDEQCKKCFGTGLLPRLGETPAELIAAAKASAPSGATVPVRDKCPTCKGHGKLEDGKECPDCDGSGHDSTEPPSDKLARVDGDLARIHEGDAKGREKVDKSEIEPCDDADECDVCKEAFGEDLEKAKLKAKARNALPDSSFALPGRRYPIHDISHARNALARVSQYGTPEEKAKVRAAVHRRYPEIASAKKADGSTFSAPNAQLAAMAQRVGDDGASDGDANAPGSPAWEAVDADIATQAATCLMAAAELIRQFKDRENQEVAAGEGNDIYDTFDACQALCAVNDALGVMARMAFHEGLEAAKSLEDDETAEKAGRRLSRKSVSSLADLRDHITNLLGDDDPAKMDTNDDGAEKSVDMDELSKEIENMEMTELTKWADARDEKLVSSVVEALKGSAEHEAAAIANAKAANSKAKGKKKRVAGTDDSLEDEATQGTNDSASSPATGAAKAEGETVDETVTTETEPELTTEQIEARDAAKAAKKAAKAAKREQEALDQKIALTKSIEESLAKVVEQNEVLKATVETLTAELDGVKKMAAPSTVSRTAPAEGQTAAKAKDDAEMEIARLEKAARDASDRELSAGYLQRANELRSKSV